MQYYSCLYNIDFKRSEVNWTLFSGYQNNLKVLYSQVPTPVSIKKSRYISSVPERILDAPDIRNDFCELMFLFNTACQFEDD